MRNLTLALLLTLSFSVNSTILVPVAPAGGTQAQFLQNFLQVAAQNYSRGGSFNLFGVTAQFAFIRNTDTYNYVDIVVNLNGAFYLIPSALASVDNFRQVVLQSTDGALGPAGVYILQGGFQWSSVLDGLERVNATIRIAGPDGSVLPQLEYAFQAVSAHLPNMAEFYPPNVSDPIAGLVPSVSRRAPKLPLDEQQVPEALPGSYDYFNATVSLDKAERPEMESFHETFAFQQLSGRNAFYGDGSPNEMAIELNDHVFILPTNFDQTDNLTSFSLGQSSTGYSMVQGGFRANSVSGQFERVEATVQVADSTGAILPSLQYSETVSPLSTPTSQYVMDVLYTVTELIIDEPHE